jgi:hypothetical protein
MMGTTAAARHTARCRRSCVSYAIPQFGADFIGHTATALSATGFAARGGRAVLRCNARWDRVLSTPMGTF